MGEVARRIKGGDRADARPPRTRPSQKSGHPMPREETTPRPVMTTRLFIIVAYPSLPRTLRCSGHRGRQPARARVRDFLPACAGPVRDRVRSRGPGRGSSAVGGNNAPLQGIPTAAAAASAPDAEQVSPIMDFIELTGRLCACPPKTAPDHRASIRSRPRAGVGRGADVIDVCRAQATRPAAARMAISSPCPALSKEASDRGRSCRRIPGPLRQQRSPAHGAVLRPRAPGSRRLRRGRSRCGAVSKGQQSESARRSPTAIQDRERP